MQIRSDDEGDDFQNLVFQDYEDQQKKSSSPKNSKPIKQAQYNCYEMNPTLSVIRIAKSLKDVFTVQIQNADNYRDLSILENQYYMVKISKNNQVVKQNIQRRYSDFDFLYELLFRKYPGFILPAFPQKGLISYLKTKVSVAKDQSFTKNRIKMIERFLATLLNEEKFSLQNCKQMKKFFSESEYQIFKKTEKQTNNNNIINTTIDKVWSYFKMNRGTKYDPIVEDIRNEKKPYQNLHMQVRNLVKLVDQEIKANQKLINLAYTDKQIPNFQYFCLLIEKYNKQMKEIFEKAQELDFDLFCENEDFLMMLRKIELFEQIKNSQNGSNMLPSIEKQFYDRRSCLVQAKVTKLKDLQKEVFQLIGNMAEIERQQK